MEEAGRRLDSNGLEMPKDKHLTSKIFTKRIELNNLMPRACIKRLARNMIYFSC